MQFIRNQHGIPIAQLQILSNGVKRIYGTSGKLLGWYDPVSDKTIDARTGNWMGFGDQVMLLITNA
jgi:hypothetical protein